MAAGRSRSQLERSQKRTQELEAELLRTNNQAALEETQRMRATEERLVPSVFMHSPSGLAEFPQWAYYQAVYTSRTPSVCKAVAVKDTA